MVVPATAAGRPLMPASQAVIQRTVTAIARRPLRSALTRTRDVVAASRLWPNQLSRECAEVVGAETLVRSSQRHEFLTQNYAARLLIAQRID
jgi:hypothetical protein